MSDSNKLSLSSKIFIGLLCGIFAGWLLAQMGESAFVDAILGALAVIKSLFVNALKMMVVPLVLVSLI